MASALIQSAFSICRQYGLWRNLVERFFSKIKQCRRTQ
jgi:hypothetical protein